MSDQPRILLTARLPDAERARLDAVGDVVTWDQPCDPTAIDLANEARGVDAILSVITDPIDATVISAASQLRVVSNRAVGFDNVDVKALTARNIPLGHTPGVLTDAVADLTMTLILATVRRVSAAGDAVKEGEWRTSWDRSSPYGFGLTEPGADLAGQTLAILGAGRIGQATATRAKAFGMHVIAVTRDGQPRQGIKAATLDEALQQADVVSVHLPLTPGTKHLIGAKELAMMKKDAVLINTARGGVIDQAALHQALREGQIAAAGLDVTDPEPMDKDDPLLRLPNCLVLPHTGSATKQARTRMATLAVDNVIHGLRGERLPHCANPEVYLA
jgi:lactate dehydrogenase-like 2-hydroxyacid dehydrogenase